MDVMEMYPSISVLISLNSDDRTDAKSREQTCKTLKSLKGHVDVEITFEIYLPAVYVAMITFSLINKLNC